MIVGICSCILWTIGVFSSQLPFSLEPNQTAIDVLSSANASESAPFIFNTLSSLLKQWPNTFHPNGHTMIPGTLAPFTLLYHARKDTLLPPPSPEWFAFDSEMSYAIIIPRSGPSYLSTYRTVRPTKILYFDGMSAAWGAGWLDTQEVLIRGKGDKDTDGGVNWHDDYGRAEKLCEWAKTRGVDGFVRMNVGFELLWCDFTSPSIQLVSHLNITLPGTPEHTGGRPGPGGPRRPPGGPPNGPGGPGRHRPHPGDPRGPGRGWGGWEGHTSPLAYSSVDEWLRAATHRARTAQPHMTLDYSGMISFYNPRLESLVESRAGKRMKDHRVWTDISEVDALSALSELDDVLSREDKGTGLDWGSVAQDIIEHWGDRLIQLQGLLKNASLTTISDFTEVINATRLLSLTPLNPYMSPGSHINGTGWDLFFGSSLPPSPAYSSTAFHRCLLSSTDFLSQPNIRIHITPQEALLRTSIEAVLHRLCLEIGDIFAESYELALVPVPDSGDMKAKVTEWKNRIDALLEWLEWSDFIRCTEICEWDSICAILMWPINLRFQDLELEPQCHKLTESTGVPWIGW